MNTTSKQSGSFAAKAALFLAIIAATACTQKESAKTGTVTAPEKDIHTAVLSDDTAALRQHIAAGTNINEKDPFGGSSPLISAAVFGKPEAARILIDAGADLNFQNNDGSTALHTAAFFCRPEIVKMLIDKGADKTIKNSFNATPYDNVAGPFADMKPAYDMMGTMLGPLGLTLDYAYLEQTRPQIAAMLK
jgi:ankyrin repeat protein